MKSVSHLPTKIDVVNFDDTNNFEMWRCEVMDALMASNLEDSMFGRKGLEQDESDGVWCHHVLINTRHQVSCVV